jgi:Protein of unknown function (DUF2934)
VSEASRQLREKAQKYRMFARSIGDSRTVQTISAFTDELDNRATMLDRPTEEQIRVRARELWEKAGKPTDRDETFGSRPKIVSSRPPDGTKRTRIRVIVVRLVLSP